MKATGMVRRVDELGRVVLPIELRRSLGIEERDPLEIYVENSNIILKKYEPACIFCGESPHNARMTQINNKNVCPSCLAKIKKTN